MTFTPLLCPLLSLREDFTQNKKGVIHFLLGLLICKANLNGKYSLLKACSPEPPFPHLMTVLVLSVVTPWNKKCCGWVFIRRTEAPAWTSVSTEVGDVFLKPVLIERRHTSAIEERERT